MNEEINHEHTDAIVCPHCGYEYEDDFENTNPDKEREYDCDNCGKDFLIFTYVSLSYTTKKKD